MGYELFIVDPAEIIAKQAVKAIDAGFKFFLNCWFSGLLINSTNGLCPYGSAFYRSQVMVKATGHDLEVTAATARKNPGLELIIHSEKPAYISAVEDSIVKYG